MKKRTVIIGASDKPVRYAYKATIALQNHGHEAIPVGLRPGQINGIEITKEKLLINNVDTVTLYVGPQNQESWKEYVISLKPKRVIFNPGTENPEFEAELQKKGIETIEACTLVMLSIGNY